MRHDHTDNPPCARNAPDPAPAPSGVRDHLQPVADEALMTVAQGAFESLLEDEGFDAMTPDQRDETLLTLAILCVEYVKDRNKF